MTIDGDEVWVGARVVGGPTDGNEVVFRAIDNGDGMNSPSDEVTLLAVFPPGSGVAAFFCALKLTFQQIFTIRDFGPGQIQVRGQMD